MEINQSPEQYAQQRKEKADMEAKAIRNREDSVIKLGALIGGTLGLYACCESENGGGFITWAFLVACGGIFGSLASTKIADKAVAKIYSQAEYDINSYRSELDTKVRHMAESAPVRWVAPIIAKEIIHRIDSADKRCHIENISTSYCFYVTNKNIVYDSHYGDRNFDFYGDRNYDFKINRFTNLTSYLEQEAVARAIASIVCREVEANYPQHTDATICISYSDQIQGQITGGCKVHITYTEPNHNYRAIQNW